MHPVSLTVKQGFRGDEFYTRAWPGLVGRHFADILLMFADAVPLGVKCAHSGEIVLNPSDDYIYAEGIMSPSDIQTHPKHMSNSCISITSSVYLQKVLTHEGHSGHGIVTRASRSICRTTVDRLCLGLCRRPAAGAGASYQHVGSR